MNEEGRHVCTAAAKRSKKCRSRLQTLAVPVAARSPAKHAPHFVNEPLSPTPLTAGGTAEYANEHAF